MRRPAWFLRRWTVAHRAKRVAAGVLNGPGYDVPRSTTFELREPIHERRSAPVLLFAVALGGDPGAHHLGGAGAASGWRAEPLEPDALQRRARRSDGVDRHRLARTDLRDLLRAQAGADRSRARTASKDDRSLLRGRTLLGGLRRADVP